MSNAGNIRLATAVTRHATLMEIAGENPFRVRALVRAAESIAHWPQSVEAILRDDAALEGIPGVGSGVILLLRGYAATGEMPGAEALSEKAPAGLLDIVAIPGVGPKTAAKLYASLGIRDLDSLAAALESGSVAKTAGLGPKLAEKLVAGIEALARRSGRHRLGDALPIARDLLAGLRDALGSDRRAEITGSLRRWEESVGDIDLLASGPLADVVTALSSIPDLETVVALDNSCVEGMHRLGFRVHIHVADMHSFESAWLATSSPAEHLQLLGDCAQATGDEAAIYETAGLPWIAPEFRHLVDACDIAVAGGFADIVALSDICGEVHCHTVWSDGLGTIEEMALAARARGYQYLGISDHSHSLGVANGLDAIRLAAQGREIGEAAVRLGFPLLRSSEVEVLKDGRLDFDAATLDDLDIVIASTHTNLKRPRAELMQRLFNALAGGHVDLLAHPSGRLVEERDPGDFDWPELFALARREGVALEINADPARLDLKAEHARQAIAAGCLIAINCDAHQPQSFANLEYGVMTARRGLVPADRVLNSWSYADLVDWLGHDPAGRAPRR